MVRIHLRSLSFGKGKMTALVTGATGFIGRRLVELLEARGVRVITTARTVSGRPKAVSSEVATTHRSPVTSHHSPTPSRQSPVTNHLHLDLARDERIELPTGIDTIFHLAGKAHALAETSQDDTEYTQINADGTRRLLEAAQRAGVRSFVFFSSVKAVGATAAQSDSSTVRPSDSITETPSDRRTVQPLDESFAYPPETAYGRSKLAAERLVLMGNHVSHSAVLRPCLVYGPNPKGNLEKMITAVRRGRFPSVPEFGNQRSMVHVDDVCAAAILAAEKPEANGNTYILADDEPFSTRQLFEWISTAVGRPIPRWTMPRWTLRALARTGDLIGRLRGRRFVFDSDALEKLSGDAWYSAEKAKRELNWQAQHSLRESLPNIVASMNAAERGGKW